MAIDKAGILAFALSFLLPVASGLSQSHPVAFVQTANATAATAIVQGAPPGSVDRKKESDVPGLMTQASLPTRLYPRAPKPYPAASKKAMPTLLF